MTLITKPILKILDKNKLHLSRRPGCTAWLLLGLSVLIFIGIFSHLTSNVYFLIILLLGELMFGLDSIGEWEDLILYKQENKAVIEKSIWSDKLYSGWSGEFSSMKLTDIQHVGISTELGLFILHRNGKIITLNMKGLTREEIQNIRKEINYFLNMSRLKYLDHSLIDSSDRLLLSCDSEEYLQNLSKVCLPTFNELTVSDNVLGNNKISSRIQQNLSFPNLVHRAQFNDYQSMNLRRSPYTENSMRFDRVECKRNIFAMPTYHNLLKFDRECS